MGLSAFFSVILALVFIYCLKNNNVESQEEEQHSSTHQRPYKRDHHQKHHRHIKHEQTSMQEITVISGVHKYDGHSQHQPSNHDGKKFSPPILHGGLTESTNSGTGKQLPPSPASKSASFGYLNQSNGSMNHQNYQSPTNTNAKRYNYNRH